jgi:glycerate-2-kinase
MNSRSAAERIFMAGVRSVLPGKLVTSVLKAEGNILSAGGHNIQLENISNIYVIGAGKASAAMGHYVENILGERVSGGHIVVKYGHSCKLRRINVTEAGHPIPDINGFNATGEIIKIAERATENDLVICLISGGGSALMADLPAGLIPEELYIVNNLLVRSGADINQINCVRKHLSKVKGGQLARNIHPASLITIMISDVVGNPLEVIASGPTVPDPSTFSEALKVIEDYNLAPELTSGIINYLKDGASGIHPETPKPGDPVFDKTLNILAGTNQTALRAAKDEATSLGYHTYIIDDSIKGDVGNVCESILNMAFTFRDNPNVVKPFCLLFGGETTIKVHGDGMGGRNQHLALVAAMKLENIPGITILSAGTDGTDGPTDAAGAVSDSNTLSEGKSLKLDPVSFISEFDSYHFFRKAGGLIRTGPTFTNVMDLIVVLVE